MLKVIWMKKLKTFLSVILIIVITILMSLLTFVLLFRKQLTKEVINKVIMENDIGTVVKDLENSSNPVISQTEKALETLGFPENVIPDVLNSEGTKRFISIYTTNTINYLLNTKEEEAITKQDLKDLVDSNINVFEKDIDSDKKYLIEEYKKNLYQYVDKHGDAIIKLFPTPKQLLEQVNQKDITLYKNITLKDVLDFLTLLNSNKLTMMIIFSIFVLCLILIIMNFKNRKWPKHLAISLFLYSILIFIIQIVIILAKKLEIFDLFKSLESFVLYIVNQISRDLWIAFIGSIVLGIIFTIIYQKIKIKETSE